jgi:hypothetical protein
LSTRRRRWCCGSYLPPKFEQIAASIETLLNLETISINELISRLKPSEKRINRNGGNSITSLNLTQDELVARLSSQLKVSTPMVTPRNHRQATTSAGAAVALVVTTATATVAMLAVGAGRTLAITAVATTAAVAVGPVETSPATSAAIVANAGTGHVSAGRRNVTKKCMPIKLKKMMNQHCSWRAR